MRDRIDRAVFAWANAESPDDLFVTAISEAEIRAGITLLPAGRRRTALGNSANRTLRALFPGRILPFDSQAALEYAAVVSERNTAGRPIGAFDGLIAAIARAHGAAVATRDVGGFEGLGIEIVNPWAVA